MPPFPVAAMDTGPAPSPSPVVAGPPPPLWRLAERRSRKVGSGNIFSNVNLWQLQRLFRAAGDQDAEQRAQLVWGQRDEAELAQALIGLRARSHRRGLRASGRDALGTRWLRAFNHLRIGDSLPSGQGKDGGEDGDPEAGGPRASPEPHQDASPGSTGAVPRGESHQGPAGSSERLPRPVPGLRRGGESNPERYLHRILH